MITLRNLDDNRVTVLTGGVGSAIKDMSVWALFYPALL